MSISLAERRKLALEKAADRENPRRRIADSVEGAIEALEEETAVCSELRSACASVRSATESLKKYL